MFYSTFQPNDRTILPFWQAIPPARADKFGNIYYLDSDLNLLLLIATRLPYCYPPDPFMDGKNAVIRVPGIGRDFVIPHQQNALILASSDGTIRVYPLAKGGARQIWDQDLDVNDYPVDPFVELQNKLAATTKPGLR